MENTNVGLHMTHAFRDDILDGPVIEATGDRMVNHALNQWRLVLLFADGRSCLHLRHAIVEATAYKL